MTDHLPSKDKLRFSWAWDDIALNWRISMIEMGDGLFAGYDHLAGYYERRLIEEIERLRTALTGISTCSTCEACRGAGKRVLGGAEPSKEQNTEALAWALRAHEDLAKMLADGGGNMLHVRANRALSILFAEVERLEKILYPIGAAQPPGDGQ